MEEIVKNKLKWEDFCKIAGEVNWFCPKKEMIEIALKNSQTYCLKVDGNVIGMARVVSDEAIFYCIRDFAVLPPFQNKGYGTSLFNFVLQDIKNQVKDNSAMIEIQSVKGKEEYYKKFGFITRPSKNGGAGLYLLLSKNNKM